MDKPLSVFTEKYPRIQGKIINSIVIINPKTNNAIPAKAQWDTGATGTCISKEIAMKLNLLPIGMQQIHTPSGIGKVKQYKVHIVLNDVDYKNILDNEVAISKELQK